MKTFNHLINLGVPTGWLYDQLETFAELSTNGLFELFDALEDELRASDGTFKSFETGLNSAMSHTLDTVEILKIIKSNSYDKLKTKLKDVEDLFYELIKEKFEKFKNSSELIKLIINEFSEIYLFKKLVSKLYSEIEEFNGEVEDSLGSQSNAETEELLLGFLADIWFSEHSAVIDQGTRYSVSTRKPREIRSYMMELLVELVELINLINSINKKLTFVILRRIILLILRRIKANLTEASFNCLQLTVEVEFMRIVLEPIVDVEIRKEFKNTFEVIEMRRGEIRGGLIEHVRHVLEENEDTIQIQFGGFKRT